MRQERKHRTMQRLWLPDAPGNEVCNASGTRDPNHFAHPFKNMEGVIPGQFRTSMSEQPS